MSDQDPVFYYDDEPPPRVRSRFVLLRRPELLVWALILCVAMCCFDFMCNGDTDSSSRSSASNPSSARTVGPRRGRVPYITVRHINTKRVARSSLGGTFRYFFDVRNQGSGPFEGEVEILLISSAEDMQGTVVGTGTFRTEYPILANGATFVSVDSRVAPDAAGMHGEYGLRVFQWRVTNNTRVIGEGFGDLHGLYLDETNEW